VGIRASAARRGKGAKRNAGRPGGEALGVAEGGGACDQLGTLRGVLDLEGVRLAVGAVVDDQPLFSVCNDNLRCLSTTIGVTG
jgi:hypothetical protein